MFATAPTKRFSGPCCRSSASGLRRRDQRGEQHPLRPCREPDRRRTGPVRQILVERPRRRDQPQQADQRRAVQRAVRRHRPVRQSPAKRLLCRRLLRLSGDQQRSRPASRGDRRGPQRSEHAGRLSSAWNSRGSISTAGVQPLVRITNCVGKALILALLSVSVSACDSGLPFGSRQADAGSLQSSVTDPQARAFYAARQWKDAWDKKAEKELVGIIAGAPGERPQARSLPKRITAQGSRGPRGNVDQRRAALRFGTREGLCRPEDDRRGLHDPSTESRCREGPCRCPGRRGPRRLVRVAPTANRRISRAQRGAPPLFETGGAGRPQPVPAGKPIKPGRHDTRHPAVAASLQALG